MSTLSNIGILRGFFSGIYVLISSITTGLTTGLTTGFFLGIYVLVSSITTGFVSIIGLTVLALVVLFFFEKRAVTHLTQPTWNSPSSFFIL
jgi:hypothetical protein